MGALKMNSANKTRLNTALFIIAVGFSASAWAAVNIELEVRDQGGSKSLVVTRNNAQCPGEPIDCIEVASGTQPHLFFTLKDACNGTDYRLTGFRITQHNKQWPGPGNPLKLSLAEDFCADEESGYVDFMACRNELKADKMKLKDYNRNSETVFYEITAANCVNPADEIYLDPQIKNKGGNN